jgi:quercetin dioxygenase-like cupin family protein
MPSCNKVLALITAGAALWPVAVNAHDGLAATVQPAFTQTIPSLPGKTLTSVIVTYPPGVKSRPHTHARSAYIYAFVISGEIRSQVDDGPVKIYRAGESWSELPGAHHVISENVSAMRPASLLAVFIADTGDTNLTTPDK